MNIESPKPSVDARRLADLLTLSPHMVFETDAAFVLTYVSAPSATILGYCPEQMLGRPLSAFGWFTDVGNTPWWRCRDQSFVGVAKDGSLRQLLISALPVIDDITGNLTGVRAIALDHTRIKADGDRLRNLAMAVEQTPSSVIITDRYGIIEYVNKTFVATTGFAPEDVLGRTPALLKSGQTPTQIYRDMWQALLTGNEWQGDLYNRKKSGTGFWERVVISPIFDENGAITHFVAVKDDITDRTHSKNGLLRHGYQDTATGLPNRPLAIDRLEQALVRARRNGTRVALLSIDLDHFKRVNDAYGYSAVDGILKDVGQRLVALVRPGDTVARTGGDEFCIVAAEYQPAEVESLAHRVLRGFGAPFMFGGAEIFVTSSIGVSVFPDDGKNGGALLLNADAAMFQAKKTGRNTVQFFTPDMNTRAAEQARLEAALHHALDRGELAMHYQPMLDLASGQVSGAEALMRWNSPEFGQIPPTRFIPLAEANGLIVRLGAWAMNTACIQAGDWVARFGPDFRIAVNVSARQVSHSSFGDMVRRSIADAGIAPHNLEIEITESLLLDQGAPVGELTKLRASGVRLSIDDFGTGYSALSYLRRFPVDTLKIDRSFLSNLPTSTTDLTLVETIISMAHCLGLEVVAEGVETDAQLSMLKGRRCNTVQGFHFSQPVPAAIFLDAAGTAPAPARRRIPLP